MSAINVTSPLLGIWEEMVSNPSELLKSYDPVDMEYMEYSDHVRREDAITAACKGFCHPGVRCPETPCREQTKYLRELPSADVAPVVHGKWIEEWWHGEKTRKCSVCNLTQTVNAYKGEVKFKYCPYCGAKMDAQGEE